MNSVLRFSGMAILAAAVCLLLPVAGRAADQQASEQVAQISAGGAAVDWQPLVSYDRLELTVSGPDGTVFHQEFAAGVTPTFGLFDAAGNHRPDGSYTYQLLVAPRVDPRLKRALAAAHAAGDDKAAQDLQKSGRLPQPLVQSGSFAIQGGTLVVAGATESRQAGAIQSAHAPQITHATGADQVIPDDLIVQGSACIGLDCVNNESFGFDTIRLKENNTRIKFDDTSTGTGFPNHDWQLTANDSASGGANKFSIEDITASTVPFTVTGSAPTNSIFVDSTGRVGFRTSTPVLDLHVNTSNTPAMRLEQNNSGGFTAQTWDIAGNEANFFVRDVTGGSRLPFRIRPGAPTSSIDINASGNVGIGTASPADKVDIQGDAAGAVTGRIKNANATGFSGWEYVDETGTVGLFFGLDNANNVTRFNSLNGNPIVFLLDSTERLRFPTTGNVITAANGAFLSSGGTWTNASSRSYKKDVVGLDASEALAAVRKLDPVKFRYQTEPGQQHVGFIAEDVPELVAMNDRKSLSSMDIVAVLTKVVQEQQKTIEQLSARLADLEHEKK
jgi:endosialidase-like protein